MKKTTNTNTTENKARDNKANFSELLEKYAKETSDTTTTAYSDALTELATAVAYSVLKKCIDTGYNETLVSIRHELTRDKNILNTIEHCNLNAYHLTYNDNGDMIAETKDINCRDALNALARQALGDGLDIVDNAILAIMEETAKQIERGETVNLETPYTVRRLKRKVWIKTADSVNGWETVETTPIREIYKSVRRSINDSKALATDARNGYSYIEGFSEDTETGETERIYRRMAKYADLGGYACDFNKACTLYSADAQTVEDTDELINRMNLTKKQAQVLNLRQSGYGYKAIATYLGVTQRAVAKTVEAIQKKAIAIGLNPNE